MALRGFARRAGSRSPLRVVVSPTEHAAVVDCCRALERDRLAPLRWLHVDEVGQVDLDQLETECRAGADLVCVMAANNEVGTVAPIATTWGRSACAAVPPRRHRCPGRSRVTPKNRSPNGPWGAPARRRARRRPLAAAREARDRAL